jgi:uncharacterized Zn-finger protein
MINIHCASKKWVCNVCGKSYAKKNTWMGHLRNHSGEEGRIFKCTYENCSKRFAQQNKLNVHLRIHSGVNIFKFDSKIKILTFYCFSKERPYACKFCERTFIHYTDHKRHEYIHVRLISQVFRNLRNLLSFQTGERPYKCSVDNCLRGFIKKSELTAHERTHR